jgi:hypothetical protein
MGSADNAEDESEDESVKKPERHLSAIYIAAY